MSKRKHKRHQKLRVDSFYSTVSTPVSEVFVSFDSLSGEITVHGADSNSGRFVRSYARKSGKDKVVTTIPTGKPSGFFDLMDNIKRNFDQIIAIDTNTRMVDGKPISVTCSYFTPSRLSSLQTEIGAELLGGYISLNCGINPERLGWHLVLSNHVKPALPSANSRIAIIVDSELGLLESFNKRESPYLIIGEPQPERLAPESR